MRDDYENLQYLHKKLEASRSKIEIIKAHVEREKALLGGEFTMDQRRFEDTEIIGIEIAILNDEVKLENAKRELAMSVGLDDGSRIRLTDSLLRSTINLESADLDYLTRMAFAFRGELGILKHERAIAEGDLAVVRAKRIPWFSFIEAAYAKDSTGGHHTNDNYGVQFGVVLPLFSWLGKDERVVEAQIESYYASLKASEQNIANEVAEAYRGLKSAAGHRNRIEAKVEQYNKALAEAAKALDGSEDLAARERLRYKTETIRDDNRQHILEVDRLYNQALIRLEQALGADLDQVFSVKFETFGGTIAAAGEVTASAATSKRHTGIPKAKPVTSRTIIKSPRKPVPTSKEKPKRKGLLNFGKRDDRSAKKPPIRKGLSNR